MTDGSDDAPGSRRLRPPSWVGVLACLIAAPAVMAVVAWLNHEPFGPATPSPALGAVIALVVMTALVAWTIARRDDHPLAGRDEASPATPLNPREIENIDIACPACGYNLRGTRGEVCPECGETLSYEAFDRADRLTVPTPQIDPRSWAPPRARQPRWARVAAVVLVGAIIVPAIGAGVTSPNGSPSARHAGGFIAVCAATGMLAVAVWRPRDPDSKRVKAAVVGVLAGLFAVAAWVGLTWP